MPFDNAFVCVCMNSVRAVSHEFLSIDIGVRLAIKKENLTNREIYNYLSVILGDIKKGIAMDGHNRQTRERKIFVE
jgi:hypothetical protein